MKKLLLIFFAGMLYLPGRAQTTDSLDPEKLLQYYETQQYTAAVQYLQSLNKDSSNLKNIKQLAYANLMAGKLSDAKEAYLQVLKIDSNDFNAYKQLAKLDSDPLSSSKKAYLLKANQLDAADAEVAAQLSEIYFKSSLFSKADEILKPALNADSVNLMLLNVKMPLDMILKRYPEAIKTGKTLMQYSKTPTEQLLFQMAICYREVKDYKMAITYFQTAIKEGISPKIASYYGLLGESYESMKQNKEAIDHYKRGLLFENNGSLYYNIALLYEDKLNDKKNAISYYTQYLNSIKDPEKQKRHIAFIKNKIEEFKR